MINIHALFGSKITFSFTLIKTDFSYKSSQMLCLTYVMLAKADKGCMFGKYEGVHTYFFLHLQ